MRDAHAAFAAYLAEGHRTRAREVWGLTSAVGTLGYAAAPIPHYYAGDRRDMGSSRGKGSSDQLLPSTTCIASPMPEPSEVCLSRVRHYVSSFPYFYAC
jgi:hypothetical protein